MKREEGRRLYLEISTPTKSLFRGFVNSVNVPIEDGMLGILPGHINTLARITSGILWARSENKLLVFFISEGFMEIVKDRVFIISEDAEIAEKLEEERLEKEKKELQEKLLQAQSISEKEEIRRALLLNNLKIKALQFFKTSTYSTK